MSQTEEPDETEQGVYEQPGGDQHDSAQPLDHRDFDDAESVGEKASESDVEAVDAPDQSDARPAGALI